MSISHFNILLCVFFSVLILVHSGEIKDSNQNNAEKLVHLDLRFDEENGRYLLEVYNPEGLASFSQNTALTNSWLVQNPRCDLEGGPLRENPKDAVVEFFKTLTWSEDKDDFSEFKYSLTKNIYKVIIEGEGYLRCSAMVSHRPGEVISERLLKRYSDHIFAMNLLHECSPTQCNNISHWIANSYSLTKSLNKSISSALLIINNVRAIPIELHVINDTMATVLYRIEISLVPESDNLIITPRKSDVPSDVKDLQLLNLLSSAMNNKLTGKQPSLITSKEIVYLRSTKYCHKVRKTALINNSTSVLEWPTTPIGHKATSLELCVGENETPLVMICEGNFITGATWFYDDTKTVECQSTTRRTQLFHDLAVSNVSQKLKTDEVLRTMMTELAKQHTTTTVREPVLSPAEIKYVAETLANIEPCKLKPTDIPTIANITNSIMTIPQLEKQRKVNHFNLDVAQESCNSSNSILESLDRILNEVDMENESTLIVTQRFVTLSVNLSLDTNINEIRGLAALKNKNFNYFKKEDIIPLTANHTVQTLLDMDIAVAVLIPHQLLQLNTSRSRRMVINLFYDDALFGASRHVASRPVRHVVSVTVDGKRHQDLNPPLILMFDSGHRQGYVGQPDLLENVNETDGHDYGSPCVFWDFRVNDGEGGWSETGCTLAQSVNRSLSSVTDVCVCTHLTHFGELLRDSPENYRESSVHTVVLDLITIIGCTVSLIGLFGIATTAIIFPEWRRGASKKVQLSLCAALGVLMLSFLSLTFMKNVEGEMGFFRSCQCIATGFSLHYSILASFCWMVVAAWGQYCRLARPLVSLTRRPHFLLKASIFAWGVPLIPCITILVLDSDVYDPPNCYPTGSLLYFSVLLPVVLAVSLNLTLFIIILLSIYNCCGVGMQLVHLRNNQSQRKIALRKLSTVIFLFLLLGLSWIFGILNMSYIFCLTATLQGLAVFVFFVVLEKKTREKWNNLMSDRKSDKLALGLHSYSNSADFIRRLSNGQQRTHRHATTRISIISD